MQSLRCKNAIDDEQREFHLDDVSGYLNVYFEVATP